MRNSGKSGKPNLGAFHVSCWVLGLVAFVQLMSVGVALSVVERAPLAEREVETRYVVIPSSTTAAVPVKPPKVEGEEEAPVPKKRRREEAIEVRPEGRVAEVPEDEVLSSPPMTRDPLVESLIERARQDRVSGDLFAALTKMTEASGKEPESMNISYELGAIYEAFGVFDKARAFYHQVYRGGPLKAGSLWEKAGYKLAYGLVPQSKDLVSLGLGRMLAAERVPTGEKRTLLLSVTLAPGKEFDPALLHPKVKFYEEVDGKVGPAVYKAEESGNAWVTGGADWKDGEEMAEVWYVSPKVDVATDFLYGEREFYGFVAELYYGNRLVDIRAQPRTLLREVKLKEGLDEYIIDELDGLDLETFGAGGSLLPFEEVDYGIPEGEPGGGEQIQLEGGFDELEGF